MLCCYLKSKEGGRPSYNCCSPLRDAPTFAIFLLFSWHGFAGRCPFGGSWRALPKARRSGTGSGAGNGFGRVRDLMLLLPLEPSNEPLRRYSFSSQLLCSGSSYTLLLRMVGSQCRCERDRLEYIQTFAPIYAYYITCFQSRAPRAICLAQPEALKCPAVSWN